MIACLSRIICELIKASALYCAMFVYCVFIYQAMQNVHALKGIAMVCCLFAWYALTNKVFVNRLLFMFRKYTQNTEVGLGIW